MISRPSNSSLSVSTSSVAAFLSSLYSSSPLLQSLIDFCPWRRWVLDPRSDVVLIWYKCFLVSCLIALFLDPFYFFLPTVDPDATCLSIHVRLRITVTVLRSVTDLFYALHILNKFRTAFVSRETRVFGSGDLVMDPKKIASRYMRAGFAIDLLATLPLPQILIWLIIPGLKNSSDVHSNNKLALIVLFQYVPRLFLIFPLNQRIVKSSGVVTKTAWAGAAYNLLLYMLASHVLGASWYLLSVERLRTCWRRECSRENGNLHTPQCDPYFLDCSSLGQLERQIWVNVTHVIGNCAVDNSGINFNYGMFADALTNHVVSSSFIEKYFYCLWWGLRNLSSYGQNLSTSTYMGETVFCILICIFGLVLFSQLIGNMQTYLQSITVRIEEWRVKQRDTEEWMIHRQLPQDLQERVRRFIHYKWLTTRGVDEESILQSLPLDLRREIQRHLCLGLVRRVPFFSQMDDQLLDAICERLVSSLNIKNTHILREGDPVNEMLFIIRGKLESSTTNGGRSGFFNSIMLGPSDFCGEELLTWALLPTSSLNLPLSTRTVRALDEVEAFALRADDLKFVANQFKRLHSKKLQHTFRFYSHQWRTWAACFIQAAWRRHKKRKLARDLEMHENLFYMSEDASSSDALLIDVAGGGSYDGGYGEIVIDPSLEGSNNLPHLDLGATILASRFAANTRRGVNQKIKGTDHIEEKVRLPKILKPDEPDFSLDLQGEE
ncbi:putative cyclic nucleotide-gated ion channel 18 [Nymphaea thermarum]|nr:putative cyclic nucleotide-gated ion channel 18 [Nymphaea thermarum]